MNKISSLTLYKLYKITKERAVSKSNTALSIYTFT